MRLFCELLSSNNLMYQVKTAIIRKLTFLHTLDSHWEIYKKCDKVKETTAQSYQKTLNRNNISRRALGLSLCFVTVWGRLLYNNPLSPYFYLFLSCEKNSWHTWTYSWRFLLFPTWTSTLFVQLTPTPSPLWLYILYGWPLAKIANLVKVRRSALPLNLAGT